MIVTDKGVQKMKNYDECRLLYNVTEEAYARKSNRENYEKMKEALEAVGVYLSIEDGKLYLSITSGNYRVVTTRKAGRKKKAAFISKELSGFEVYKYADIVYMMQTMKDADIAEKIGMPIATFYRHKKEMKKSVYYKSLDLNRLRDKEYLDSVDWNWVF